MRSEEIKKNRILEFSFKKFTSNGIPQVTMDEIARGVGMGKGTLYKYFPSKEILLLNTIDFFAAQMERKIEAIILDETLSPFEKLNSFVKTVAEKLSMIHPSTLIYIERSMPEVFEKIQQSREQIMVKNFARLFDEGKVNGLFNEDMDNYLVTQMFIGTIKHLIDSSVLTTMNYSLDSIFKKVIAIIFNGCLTQEGRRLYTTNYR